MSHMRHIKHFRIMIGKRLLFSAIVALSTLTLTPSQAQLANRYRSYEVPDYPLKDSITKNGFKLVFISNDPTFSPTVKAALIKTFFTVYPPIVERFNKESLRRVIFAVDTAYDNIAITMDGGLVVFNPKWFVHNPEDFDVVTHEVMHIAQEYGRNLGNNVPVWVTEGIADYVRYRYGIHNAEANWNLPDPLWTIHHYTNSYKITARFFVWLEERKDPQIIDKIDAAARNHKYHSNIWVELTGRTIDELWEDYNRSPSLHVQWSE